MRMFIYIRNISHLLFAFKGKLWFISIWSLFVHVYCPLSITYSSKGQLVVCLMICVEACVLTIYSCSTFGF